MILTWKNIETGALRTEVLTYIGSIGNCHNLYKTEKGEYYTRGIAGWINVSKYVK